MANEYDTNANSKYVEELKEVLGGRFADFFPSGIEQEIEKETFQSKEFQSAGWQFVPGEHGAGDRNLYVIRKEDGTVTIVSTGKASENPFAFMVPIGGLDMRQNHTIVYDFDGQETINETILNTGETNQYSGDPGGNPEALITYLRSVLGKRVDSD